MNTEIKQYTKVQILGLWFAVAAPMGLFRFVLMPRLAGTAVMNPGILYWIFYGDRYDLAVCSFGDRS